jgi:hypothetical protein
LTHNLPKIDAEKFKKYETLATEIKNNWRFNNEFVHPLVVLVEGAVTKNFLKYLENIGLTILRVGQNVVPLQNASYSMQILWICPLILGGSMNFLPMSEPNPTDNLGKVSRTDAEK